MNPINIDPWENLKSLTQARIALGRAGTSIPTEARLKLLLDHAKARDAVHDLMDINSLKDQIEGMKLKAEILKSHAQNRSQYLQNPFSGRKLNNESLEKLKTVRSKKDHLVCINICDGLSARAVNEHSVLVLKELLKLIERESLFNISSVYLVSQGRVAIGDEIASLIDADYNITFIGERPGLSSADSLGCYMSYKPQADFSDDQRNCISNIRPEGLSIEDAAGKIYFMLCQMRDKKQSGIMLKDRTEDGKISL